MTEIHFPYGIEAPRAMLASGRWRERLKDERLEAYVSPPNDELLA